MSSDWQVLTLGDVCEKITDGAHKSPKSVDDGKLMASVKDLTRFGVDLSDARKISKEDFDELVQQGCKPCVGDVLIAKDGNSALDTVCTVDSELDAVLLSSVAILRPNPEKLDSNFLKYYFCSPKIIDYLKTNFISGAAIPRVVLRDFRKAVINIPSLNIQRKISQCLGLIDNKIFNNTQTNQTLEEMAQAIFKSWFVDFDPVKAKMNGEQPEGMDEATASLFPEKLVESELGLIPEGWEEAPLYDIADYINGAAYKKFEPNNNGIGLPIIKIAELKSGITSKTGFSTVEMPGKYRLEDKDILFSWSGNPDTSIDTFVWALGEAWLNQHIFKVVPKNKCSRDYVLCLLKFMKPVFAEIARDKQTTGLGHVTVKDLKRLMVVLPPKEVLLKFNEKVSALISHNFNSVKQNQTLEKLRDTLLPKLLSGEIELEQTNELAEVS